MSQQSSSQSPTRSEGAGSSSSTRSAGYTTSGTRSIQYSTILRTAAWTRRPSSGYISPYPPLTSTTPSGSNVPTSAKILDMSAAQSYEQQRRAAASETSSSVSSSTDSSAAAAVERRSTSASTSTPQARRAGSETQGMSERECVEPKNVAADPITKQAQKQALIDALVEHRINTLAELRRIERVFAQIGSSDVTRPMTAAWTYYVNSNSLLAELRGLTRNYPFSAECIEEGKRRVHQDPGSNRSWNYCWLVLAKVHTDRLIPTYARQQASLPLMWGGRRPSSEEVDRLSNVFTQEWTAALQQMLRYWETAPIVT